MTKKRIESKKKEKRERRINPKLLETNSPPDTFPKFLHPAL